MASHSHSPLPIWSILVPILAWVLYFIGIKDNAWLEIGGGLLLIGSVLAAVHHAEVVAHKVGEPFGSIVLALAITVIEVALIVALMVAGGDNAAYLARDTIFAAIMLILNGILGICLMIGGWKHRDYTGGHSGADLGIAQLHHQHRRPHLQYGTNDIRCRRFSSTIRLVYDGTNRTPSRLLPRR